MSIEFQWTLFSSVLNATKFEQIYTKKKKKKPLISKFSLKGFAKAYAPPNLIDFHERKEESEQILDDIEQEAGPSPPNMEEVVAAEKNRVFPPPWKPSDGILRALRINLPKPFILSSFCVLLIEEIFC